jgi:hypothetical protein
MGHTQAEVDQAEGHLVQEVAFLFLGYMVEAEFMPDPLLVLMVPFELYGVLVEVFQAVRLRSFFEI